MNELQQIQQCLLTMLKAFHSYCVEHNIRYYALGGTLLGALRHKGFIPWDDDIDLGIPREDYNLLITLLNNQKIDDRYLLETPLSNDPNYCCPYCKLYDTQTTLIENVKNKLVRGVYLDIFPLDGLGNSKEEARSNYKVIQHKLNLLALRQIKLKKGRSFYKNALLFLAQAVPNFIISEKKLSQKINEVCQKVPYKTAVWGGNLVGAWGLKEIVPLSEFSKPTLYDFEDTKIFGPEQAEDYLKNIYGDWRKLPPEEKRVSHHGYYLDLPPPYAKYSDKEG